MLRHQDVWQAIDRLAENRGFSPSALARRAGLDPTTFNKSKRFAQDGRPRWPSTESIAKVLEATEATLADFVALIGKAQGGAGLRRPIPLATYGRTTKSHFDEAGHPAGNGWNELAFPDIADAHAYALEIAGGSLAPVYRDGDTILVSPAATPRSGDRVVVRTRADEIIVQGLARRSARKLELAALASGQSSRTLPIEAVVFVHRIVWVSQ
jgi:phage repressor protein C with HTH and peptisase S24 domain